ncbi:MAG: gamma-glutamyltransferase family protein [Betaproteobacteria bacterium]|nr:gamma-glutamyltransferase family protein [Betaproteobacteria bacterium]
MGEERRTSLAFSAASMRPTVIGRSQAVSTGHYLATLAAMRVLDAGGNAVDAGVTASMALAVLQPDIVSFAGVAPTLIYLERENRVISLAGLGYWPAATDIARLRAEGDGSNIPEGLLRTVMPAAPATHIEALRRYGTISFAQAATPAMELARDGFGVYPFFAYQLNRFADGYRRWPESARIFLPGGKPPACGELFRQQDLGRSIAGMIEAERDARGDRDRKLRAAHDFFYRGPIAQAVADYHEKNRGFVVAADLAGFEVPVEDSIAVTCRGYEVHSCDVWCQGVTLLETLKILEGFDLGKLGHNTPDYVHTVAEAFNLSFADREAYVGDPRFVRVPTAALLSDDYAARQRARIDPRRAFGRMPDPGNPRLQPAGGGGAEHVYALARGKTGSAPDTIYAAVMDGHGNAYSATLSDTTHNAPVIPGIGMVLSSRGQQSRLTPGHPAEVAPGKRPRLTPSPALALKDGKPFMCFGTPGGDVQAQAMLQVFINVTQYGMQVQQAVEAQRFSSANFPNSFPPHEYFPGRLCIEEDMPNDVIEAMRARGHDVEVLPRLPAKSGAVCAVMRDPRTGLKHAGADPRREAYALAW